eukprot:CAMPEP_0182463530 /NCGR_PEP_ID=MMETSP1319-20130603/7645_1 /TAXON_ID=172717 /ORGANISM="Bolidomonas pacifica, Strain RCC208" /LENGTH=71 /DNA_ID=CAMNT_0024663091 /DNA_START=26 /DNA_END=241 /DNA_ORIENTATION=+
MSINHPQTFITPYGSFLAFSAGASLSLGYYLLQDFTLRRSLKNGFAGGIFTLGFYTIVPTWVRQMWLSKLG